MRTSELTALRAELAALRAELAALRAELPAIVREAYGEGQVAGLTEGVRAGRRIGRAATAMPNRPALTLVPPPAG